MAAYADTALVRFVMPITVAVDDDANEITRVVTLPEEMRGLGDDGGHFLIYNERFVRRSGDGEPQTHASCVTEPPGEYGLPPRRVAGQRVADLVLGGRVRFHRGDEAYGEIHRYGEPRS